MSDNLTPDSAEVSAPGGDRPPCPAHRRVIRSTFPRADPHQLQLDAGTATATAIAALFPPGFPAGNTTDPPPVASQARSGASRLRMEQHP